MRIRATCYQPQSGKIFVAPFPEYMLEVQRTAIYFGALHLQHDMFKKATNRTVRGTYNGSAHSTQPKKTLFSII